MMRRPATHVDLFSGLAGFTLAAHANGIKTVAFVEKDQRCRDFLSKAWPGVAIYEDIKQFDGEQYAGAYLLTAGVTCQPASRAGRQGGATDDRWLWPDALRVFAEVRPAWAVFENPPGIADVGLAGILSNVESHGYSVRVFGIPACAVGSPHRRMRYWIVCKSMADAGKQGREGSDATPGAHGLHSKYRVGDLADRDQGRRENGQCLRPDVPGCGCGRPNPADDIATPPECGASNMADAGSVCDDRRGYGHDQTKATGARTINERLPAWGNYVWLPCADGKLRRAPDDTFSLVDGLHRSVLGALGNSIVWQVAAEIIGAIIKSGNKT